MPKYTLASDLGGAPFGEPCAQLGQTNNFATINTVEVQVYIAALVALYGPTPEGVRLRSFANRHDFGIYRTAIAEIDEERTDDPNAAAYLDALENGIERWTQAGFAPPITYGTDGTATMHGRSVTDIIRGAMMTTRPAADGSFFPADFRQLHQNLRTAYPQIATETVAVTSGA